MPRLQQLAPEEPRMMYAPGVWLLVGLALGYLLCRAGLG